MPDLDIVVMQQCSSWEAEIEVQGSKPGTIYVVSWCGPENPPFCQTDDGGRDWKICPGFKFSKDGTCRHVKEAARRSCHWHQQWSEEPIETDGVCPRCGASTVYVRCAT